MVRMRIAGSITTGLRRLPRASSTAAATSPLIINAARQGESRPCSYPQKMELFRAVVESGGRRRVPVSSRTWATTAADTVELRPDVACGIRSTALCVVVPYYNLPRACTVTSAPSPPTVELPIILHNIPGYAW